ncbi:hypothetical protein HY633_04920 [Candidatus Uhrbacteria bacterium]|nr:hypothetical protein [Candidatus Uhrbacteria bacterium]
MPRTIRLCAVIGIGLFLASSDVEARRPKKVRDPVPGALLGSVDSLARENDVADRESLERLADLDELRARIGDGTLVPIRAGRDVAIDDDLGTLDRDNVDLYRHARPWVARFVADLGKDFRRTLGRRLVVASLVRTDAYQQELIKINSSAAAGLTLETRSTHLTGSTVDISTKGLSRREVRWLRRRLLAFEAGGKIQATEERHTKCFHVMVFPGYAGIRPIPPLPPPRPSLPGDHDCTRR